VGYSLLLPNSVRRLDSAVKKLASGDKAYLNIRSLIANSIVGQLLPNCVVKGGTSLKLRYGDAVTRFTIDLDSARTQDTETFTKALERALSKGWCGFTGRVVAGSPAHPKDVPPQYVMQPFDVKLNYLGKPWCTVSLEVGHNEIGDAAEAEMIEPTEANAYLEKLGFPKLGPIACMPLHFQVAQKLHGASEADSKRAHDLIDLQLIMKYGEVDLAKTREVCVRLFSYRRQQAWPPHIEIYENWERLYASQASGLPVFQNVNDAAKWANVLIQTIDDTRR